VVLACQPIDGSVHVLDFAASVMLALAEAGAAKVEAQHGKPEAEGWVVEHLHGAVDDLVVHGPAAHGMRMADQGGEGGMGQAFVQQRLEPSCRTGHVHAAQAHGDRWRSYLLRRGRDQWAGLEIGFAARCG
jgi:hypothetical protein